MPFSCGRTCVIVAVIVLVGFVVVALVCERRETFDGGANKAVDTLHTSCASKTLHTRYEFIDPSDQSVCYPSEVYKRTYTDNDTPPCTSFRVQNPAIYSDNIYFSKDTSVNPLKRIVFPQQKGTTTLKDVLLDPNVQTRVNTAFAEQERMSTAMNDYHKKMKDYKEKDIQATQKLVNNISFVPHTITSVPQLSLPTPLPKSTIPNIKASPPVTAPKHPLCMDPLCDEYEEFKYTTDSYGVPDPSSLNSTQVPPDTPNNGQAMRITNVRIPPNPAPFTC